MKQCLELKYDGDESTLFIGDRVAGKAIKPSPAGVYAATLGSNEIFA
jgi:hypothetical protein